MNLKQRAEQLRRVLPQVDAAMAQAAKNATLRAIETAAELTPPTGDSLSGTNTRSGEMKQHWSTDSRPDPVKSGGAYQTQLNNNVQYASFVNDGHRMDRHFVPGLVLNPESGMLEYNPDGKGGIVVGTKTKYVPGLHMTDEARKAYSDTVREELRKVEELLK